MNVDWSNPTIQGVVIAGLIGLVGVVVAAIAGVLGALGGAALGAKSARQVADLTRQDARSARFADRTRELAAEFVVAANREVNGATAHFAARRQGDEKVPDYRYDPSFWSIARELRFVVRLPGTHAAVKAVEEAVYTVVGFADPPSSPTRPDPDEWRGFHQATRQYRELTEAFEEAVRRELERD